MHDPQAQSERKSPVKLLNGAPDGENSCSHPRSLFSGLRSRKAPGDLSPFRDPSRDPLPILFWIGWPLLVAGQLADYLSTLAALGAGGIEANPLMQPLVQAPLLFLAVKAGFALLVVGTSWWLYARLPAHSRAMVLVCTAISWPPAVSNLLLLLLA